MNRKAIILIIFTIAIIMGILTGIYIYRINNKEIKSQEISKLSIKVEDECTEFALSLEENINTITANSNEEKISPNAELILKKHYKQCNHTIKEYIELPKELVNKNYNELKEQYDQWQIEEFSSTKIILYKQEEGICNQHYILKEDDGYITIYTIDAEGNETYNKKTEIAIQYLPVEDLEKLQTGIKAFGKEELNSILEDFE